ncbi:ABC transporter substrate-binding protein [Phytohabitans kaempferiae]|uniref:ABC transporter substrate-binding protein n=1 Tax=Phytohabitans kaempferiae TaxID=1620943 RepID=A0ABV6LYL8_9ACTN
MPRTIAVAVAAVLVATACGSSDDGDTNSTDSARPQVGDPPKGSIVVRQYAGMRSSDPFSDSNTSSWQFYRQVFEGLVTVDARLQPKPLIAESWTVNDNATEFTFKIRDGLFFHNDQPITADDVKYSLEYFHANAEFDNELGDVKSVDVVDPLTVSIKLGEPKASLVDDLAAPISAVIVPKGSADGGAQATKPIGSGPYKVEVFEPEVRAVVVPFEKYKPIDAEPDGLAGRRQAMLERVEFQVVPEDGAAAAGLETGQFDVDIRVAPSEAERLDALPDVSVLKSDGSSWTVLSLNLASGAPIDNLKVRQAITYALDRQKFLDVTNFGYGRVTGGYVPPEVHWFVPGAHDYWPYDNDPEKAKQLLREAGYNNEPIELIAGGPAYQGSNAVVAEQQLKAVGLNVKVNKLEHATFLSRGVGGKYQMNSAGGAFMTTPDVFYIRYYCNASKRYGYCNPEYDRIYDEATGTVDQEKRKALFAQLEKMLKDDAVILPLYLSGTLYGANERVKGFEADTFDSVRLWNVWVTD